MKNASITLLAVMLMGAAPPPADVDWGGGYHTGPDSILTTPASSGGGETPLVTEAVRAAAMKCAGLAAYATAFAKANPARARFAQIPDAPTALMKAEVIPAQRDVPEYCRVDGVVAPAINFELSMPTVTWNGKFMHYGCGGACGILYRPQLEEPLARGYAVVASDMGHAAAPNVALYRYAGLQDVIDFGFRATHVVTLAAKEVIDAYYGHPARLSYYMGCSTGGVQGVIEAQRYPYDFNGILVGAPAYESGPSFLEWNARANLDAKGDPILSVSKLPMIRKAVLADCDKLDGLEDGLIQNPLKCHWDPGRIACGAARDAATCLTAPEIAVVRKIYSGPTDSAGHSLSYGAAGMSRGSEYLWSPSFIATKEIPSQWLPDPGSSFGDGVYPVAAANAGKLYDYDVDPRRGSLFFGGSVLQWMRYAGNPDLRRFRDSGAKLILYHGWDDNEVAPGASVDYDELVTATMGGEAATRNFFRLFMIPGMAHCRRGPGGDAADMITALETWVEKGQAPDRLIVHHLVKEQNYLGLPRPRYPLPAGSFDRTRPVYPWPDTAAYSGHGDPALAENWTKAPRP
jgi:feruloyl esterase